MRNIKMPCKNKSLSLFHTKACFLIKDFIHDLQHLLSCTKKIFNIVAISETRITKQVSLLNNLKNELKSTFIEIVNLKKSYQGLNC